MNVKKSTVIEAVQDVVESLFNVRNEYIKFPETEQEAAAIIRTFEEYSDLPNIAGAIDGTHIRIEAPKDSAVDIFSRYQQHDFVVSGSGWRQNNFYWLTTEWTEKLTIVHFWRAFSCQHKLQFHRWLTAFWYFKWILLISADFQKFIMPHPYTTVSLIFLLILWNLRNFSGTRKTGSHFKSSYVDKKVRK